MSTACTVQRLGPNEVGAVVALRREALALHPLAFSASPPDDPELLIDSFRSLLALPEEAAIFGAFVADTLVGMVGVVRNKGAKERHKALIWGMYVRAQNRRTGAGEQLLRAAIHQAQSWPGVEQAQLTVTELAGEARRLYERNGFQEWGREPRALCWQGRYVEDRHMFLDLRVPQPTA
ncbi:MAG TPA: GNAT family N-acetyltransferase [Candidatus Binatia bacterium]|jgi:GNAT superfamily N-acetyltransferase|nr:GNAT family N-acetyltransferase [Candidatus Binatia bacterium]